MTKSLTSRWVGSKVRRAAVAGAAVLALLPAPGRAAAPESINLRRTITVEIVQQTRDQVVSIRAKKIIAQRVSPFGDDPFMAPFGPRQTKLVPSESLGSGFVIHEDGYVVTNNHVVDRAREIYVEFRDGRKLSAEILATDPANDLAVLRVATKDPLSPIALGDSSDLMTGEPVVAVGNPFGFQYSVSTGVVSAVHRELTEVNNDTGSVAALTDLIQTDAAINPGNSGGPLLNAYGQVIGINTAIRGDAQLIGFAIPINRLRDLIPTLMSPTMAGQIDVPMNLTERRDVSPPAVVKPTVIFREGQTDLEVKNIGGRPIRDLIDAYAQLLKYKPGDTIRVMTSSGERTATASAVPVPDALAKADERFGLKLVPVTPRLAATEKLAVEDGFLVESVKRNSAGYQAGLRPGDVIIGIAGLQLRSIKDLGVLISKLPPQRQAVVNVVRGEAVGYTKLKT